MILITGAPQLASNLIREAVEGSEFSLDLSTGPSPFPYPKEFQWSRNGVPLRNSSGIMWGYPGVTLGNVSRSDAGLYSLSATNYWLDDPSREIGSAVGSFQLSVLCESYINSHVNKLNQL